MTDTAIPPVDPGNQLLAPVPAQLTTAVVNTPDGQRAVMTVRTPSATVTVFLERDDVRAWGAKLSACADDMTGLTIVRGGTPSGLLSAVPGV